MDQPKRKGLAPCVGNLLILAFAEQTNRAFYWNARPFPNPTLDNLRDDMELRQQELPDEAEWEAARRRAKEVFGLGDFDAALLTAANVAALAGKVQELAERHRGAAPRPGPRGPAGAGPDGRHGRGDRPGPAMQDRPGGRALVPGWSARTRRPP